MENNKEIINKQDQTEDIAINGIHRYQYCKVTEIPQTKLEIEHDPFIDDLRGAIIIPFPKKDPEFPEAA